MYCRKRKQQIRKNVEEKMEAMEIERSHLSTVLIGEPCFCLLLFTRSTTIAKSRMTQTQTMITHSVYPERFFCFRKTCTSVSFTFLSWSEKFPGADVTFPFGGSVVIPFGGSVMFLSAALSVGSGASVW